jgi:hypothetical protein
VTESPNNSWTPTARVIVFALAFTSIACLVLDMYRLCPMRVFVLALFAPAMICLAIVAGADWSRRGRQLARAVWVGAAAGLIAAVAYDIFRIPFVWAAAENSGGVIPALPLFKVFPRFGAMILGQPLEQPGYSVAAHALGWAYHFSNGVAFGIMYVALVGDPAKRSWIWAVVMAAGLELGMLLTPYPQVFGIHVTATFITVTLLAHLIFGIVLGFSSAWLFARQPRAALAR